VNTVPFVFVVWARALLLFNLTRQRLEKVQVTRRRDFGDLKQHQSLPTCQGYWHYTVFISHRILTASIFHHLLDG
jgi:hypothetical protein